MIGERFDELIHGLGLSYTEMAEELGVSDSRVRDIVKGRAKSIPPEIQVILIERYNVNLNWLITGRGEMFIDEPPMPAGATPAEQDLLRLVRRNPELMPIYRSIGEGTSTIKQMVTAIENLPEPKRKTALKLIQALEG